MRIQNLLKVCVLGTFLFSTGCSFIEETPALTEATVGGIGGAAIGSGVGALIGNSSSVGAAQGAWVGAAIGLPVGAALGVAYYNIALNLKISRNQKRIDWNSEQIQITQREIDSFREQQAAETESVDVDSSRFEYIYDGPTMGQYNR